MTILSTTGLGSCLLLALVMGWLAYQFWKDTTTCPLGLDDTHSAQSPSSSQPTAVPVTSASSLARPVLTTSCPGSMAAATRSRTYAPRTAYATADGVPAASSGSDPDTAPTCYIPNNQPSSGSSLTADPLDISRRPVHFFSSKKKLGRPQNPSTDTRN